jgi:hypothetical protein
MSAYGTAEDCASYHVARGNTAWADASASPDTVREAARVAASDFIDSYRRRFPGQRAEGRSQTREWPRKNAVDTEGNDIAEDETPVEVEQASYEAALLIVQGVDLRPTEAAGGSIGRKRVKAGPVETETEFSTPSSQPRFQKIMDLLEPILTGGGTTVDLLRV